MNNYFVNITADLDLKQGREKFYDTSTNGHGIKKKFQGHQSILNIKDVFFNVTDLCSLHEITEDEIRKEISKIDGSKVPQVGDIPVEMLKSRIDVHVSLLTKIINSSLRIDNNVFVSIVTLVYVGGNNFWISARFNIRPSTFCKVVFVPNLFIIVIFDHR